MSHRSRAIVLAAAFTMIGVAAGPRFTPAGGLRLTVEAGATAVTLALDPVTVVQVRGETYRLTDEPPKGWAKGTRLVKCKSRGTTLPGCLVPGSVVVSLAAGGSRLEEGKDFLIDRTWGMLGRVPGGRIGPETLVSVNYAYSLQRLDTIQISPEGKITVRKGVEAKTCPLPAGAEPGWRAAANVFLDYNAAELKATDVFPIGPPLAPPSPEELRAKAATVAKSRAKLEGGQSLRVVFWGDSVTTGGDASRPECRFPDAFIAELRKKYSRARIDFHNAGIGGSSTSSRMAGMKPDVIDHHPDLVVIEFVNDMGLSKKMMHERYGRIIDQIRAVGAEVILVTPHFTMPRMMGFADPWGVDRRPACQALREIAQEKHAGLADAARVWQHLARIGLPYTTLLYNGINHPDDRGHRLFVDELLKFYSTSSSTR